MGPLGQRGLGVFGVEHLKRAQQFLDLARIKNRRIATAESCTGGLLAGAITEIAGSSDVFDCGFVTYSNSAKIALLGVRASTLEEFGAVSETVALEMAIGALARSAADIAVSVTGIAGPGSSDNKPEGWVCFALARTGQNAVSETIEISALGRSKVRATAVDHALKMLISAVS